MIPFYHSRVLSFANRTETAGVKEAEEYLENINRIFDKTISGKMAKEIFKAVSRGEGEVDARVLEALHRAPQDLAYAKPPCLQADHRHRSTT